MSINLTSLEKKAVTKVLFDIINADGRITVGEGQYFLQLKRTIGISDSEIEEAKFMSVLGCLSILRGLTSEEKAALTIMMLEMINADGNISEDEMKVFIVVCAGADIPLPNFKKVV